jgi:HSP20 family molecular chaperone IbpA
MAEQEITAFQEKQQVEGQEKTRAGRFFLPRVDIYEFDDSIKLWVDMPGIRESDVEVTHRDGVLTITGTVSTKAYEKLAAIH